MNDGTVVFSINSFTSTIAGSAMLLPSDVINSAKFLSGLFTTYDNYDYISDIEVTTVLMNCKCKQGHEVTKDLDDCLEPCVFCSSDIVELSIDSALIKPI